MEFLHAMIISSASQQNKANQDSWCIETPKCSCAECKAEAEIGSFTTPETMTHGPPKIAQFPDGHRCKRFPCPICNPGRSQHVAMPQMLEQYPHDVPVISKFGDGGHRCRKFPCPVCQTGRASLDVNGY